MPPKNTEPAKKMAEGEYTASDAKKAAGLSYRQLNNWNSKGALPGERDGEEGWNKFTPRDIFTLMVCSEIRKQFHVPLESLRWIQACMKQEGAHHFQVAIDLISTYGLTVWLLTDCKETFVMDSDFEFEDMLNWGYFRGDEPDSYIFLKINPIVNKLLSCLKSPIELKTHDAFYTAMRENQMAALIKSPQELAILKLIRSGDFHHIRIKLNNGQIHSAEGEEDISASDQKRLLQIIDQHKYQTITIKKHDGKVVRLNRKVSFKLSETKNSSITLPTEKT